MPLLDMGLTACVVRCDLPGVKDASSACGTLLQPEQGLILTHGSILTELCLTDPELMDRVRRGELIEPDDLNKCRFTSILDNRWSHKQEGTALTPVKVFESISVSKLNTTYTNSLKSFTKTKSVFLGAFRNIHFHDALQSLMPKSNWSFAEGESHDKDELKQAQEKETFGSTESQKESDCVFQLMSYFIILKVNPLMILDGKINKNVNNLLQTTRLCSSGDVAELVSTPFGALSTDVFFNSYSRGVVSNVHGVNRCWVLTDARCIPGSEGAPLFTRQEGHHDPHLTGMVAASLCWKNNEWVGFSVACSLGSIMRTLAHCGRDKHKASPILANINCNIIDVEVNSLRKEPILFTSRNQPLLSSTVHIQVGSTWGSGVIVDRGQGLILTCSHVLKDAGTHSVLVTPCRGHMHHKAEVIYRQNPLQGPFDVAVLRCADAMVDVPPLPFPWSTEARVGQEVFAVGHAVFGREAGLMPCVSAGVVSKVLKSRGRPVMVQSTCAVHPGASGGALMVRGGALVGLMVCNTRDTSSGTSYPHVNMSVPASVIHQALREWEATRDKVRLEALMVGEHKVAQLWALGSPASHTVHLDSQL